MRNRLVFSAFSAAAVLAVVWPFLFGGQLAWRDMLVLDYPQMTASNFGGGDLFARNAPQDGFLSIIAVVMPATWVVKALMVASAVGAATGAWWLSNKELLPTLSAIALAVANPFVIERLLQGHWSVVIAAWLLPLIAAAALNGRALLVWLLVFVASLTPTGALVGITVALVCMNKHRLVTLGLGVLYLLPWAIPGIIATFRGGQDMNPLAAAQAFAPRAEEAVGTLGALLGLGGIWNADAVPDSRHLGFALFGLGVFACVLLGIRSVPKRLIVLALVGMGIAIFAWLAPAAMAWALEHIPGAGLFRDSQKLLILALPAYVAAIGRIPAKQTIAAACALGFIILQTPDASSSLAALRGTHAQLVDPDLVREIGSREVLFVDRDTLVTTDGRLAIDPYSKVVNKVESGQLTVDGEVVDIPSPRWQAAMTAWQNNDRKAVEELGIGVVVEGEEIVYETAASTPKVPWILTSLWILSPLIAALARAAILRNERQSNPTKSPEQNL